MKMPVFDIQLRSESRVAPLTLKRLQRIIRKILKTLGREKAGLSVLLTGDRQIRKVNRLYLKHDCPTDVIAFGQGPVTPKKKDKVFLGDLVVSVETARRQAKIYRTSYPYELSLYLCHGILHLLGWKDKTPADFQSMDKKQRQILQQIGIRA